MIRWCLMTPWLTQLPSGPADNCIWVRRLEKADCSLYHLQLKLEMQPTNTAGFVAGDGVAHPHLCVCFPCVQVHIRVRVRACVCTGSPRVWLWMSSCIANYCISSFSCMFVGVLLPCLSLYHVCGMPVEARIRCPIPWDWSDSCESSRGLQPLHFIKAVSHWTQSSLTQLVSLASLLEESLSQPPECQDYRHNFTHTQLFDVGAGDWNSVTFAWQVFH